MKPAPPKKTVGQKKSGNKQSGKASAVLAGAADAIAKHASKDAEVCRLQAEERKSFFHMKRLEHLVSSTRLEAELNEYAANDTQDVYADIQALKLHIECKKLDGELQQMNAPPDPHQVRKKNIEKDQEARRLDAIEQSLNVPEIFSCPNTSFVSSISRLRLGSPLGFINSNLPTYLAQHTRHYYIDSTGPWTSLYKGAHITDPSDVAGYDSTILVCELDPSLTRTVLAKKHLVTAAACVLPTIACRQLMTIPSQTIGVATIQYGEVNLFAETGSRDFLHTFVRPTSLAEKTTHVLSGLGSFLGWSAMAGATLTMIDFMTYVKKAVLRAAIVDVIDRDNREDPRPLDDVLLGPALSDRLLKVSFFVELTLMDGAKILSFDPTAFNLYNFMESKYLALGCLATDENRIFKDLWISEHMYSTVVSRHSLIETEFEKARAVARISKLLSQTPDFFEDHDIRFQTGDGVYTSTLRFATLMVTKDPYKMPADF